MSQRAAAAAAPVRATTAKGQSAPPLRAADEAACEPGAHAYAPGPFTALPPGSVADADAQRRLLTQRLLEQLAPALGIDLERVRVTVGGDERTRLDSAGAQGLQDDARIWLHPAHYEPRSAKGRYLLAHEAAHAAQRTLGGTARVDAAEAEADAFGRDFSSGRAPARPRIPLRSGRAAAFAGADTQPPPAIDTATVRTSRSRELAVIRSALGGLWVSDGDVFDVMRILDSVPYPIVHPLLMALSEKERFWLADNINPPHVYNHRRSVLACYHDTLSDRRLRDAVDLKVFKALPIGGMATEEIEAAAWVLQHLSDAQRRELLRSSNGPAITRIISAPRPSEAELARMAREAEAAARDEARLADERRAIVAMAEDGAANTLFDRVRRLLTHGRGEREDFRPTGADARAALDLLGQASGDRARLLYVAERMQESGLIDRLLELLPANSYFDTPEHGTTLTELVRSRLAFKNEQLIEDLLSYGLFDWAIRDYEALFAYKLIRLMPVAAQYRFRLRDGGKWYLRLLDNLPDDPHTRQALPGIEFRKAESRDEIARMRSLGATEVDEENLIYNASQVYEKKRREAGTEQAIRDLVAAFEAADKGSFRREEAEDLFRRLVALGGASLERGRERPADDILRATVVHELERRGWIDRLFEALPYAFLFAERNRIATVKLMLARDPARVTAHARELVSRRFTDWMVTDGEAYLAYQCLKALPAEERDRFIADEPELWGRVQSEMSDSMRRSRDLNVYIGDRAGVDRAGVLGRLADGATWTEDNAALLGDLVRMAIAMTEHRFAFERSREFNAIGTQALAPLVEKYRLWDPVRRPTYTPDVLKGTRWYEEGPFATLRSLWGGLVTLATMDVLFVERKVGVRVDLGHVQDFMGGDLMGAQLATPRRGAAAPAHPDANKVTLLVGLDGQSAELSLPELQLESTNIQLGGSTLQSGRVTLTGLQLNADYDSPDMIQPARARAKFDALEANDLLLAKSASMITVTRLAVSALRLAAGTIDTVSPGLAEKRGRSVPFPLLVVPLLALFVLLALPVYLYRKIASLVSQGLEGATTEHFAADVAQRTKAISFTLGSLDVDSLTTSGGQHVGRAAVRDFAVRVGLNRATRLEAESRSLSQRMKALQDDPAAAFALHELAARKARVDAELASAQRDQREYVAIMKEIRAGDASGARQKALQQRLDALDFESGGGAFIDVGSIEVADVSGTVTAREPIRLDNIHGEGGGAALTKFIALPTVTDAELSRRSAAGERPDPLLAKGEEGRFSLDLGTIRTGELRIGGGLRSVAEIDRELAALAPMRAAREVAPLVEALESLRAKAIRYEAMVSHGVSRLNDEQLAEFRRLRTDLAAQAELVLASLEVVHAQLDVDVASGRIGFQADRLRATGIEAPGRGIQVDEIVARGLGASALPKGGLLAWTDPGNALQDAEGHIDSLDVVRARSKYHGLLFEKATLTGAYAKLRDRGNELEAGLKQFSVEQVGLAPQVGLMQQRLAGLKEKARIADPPARGRLESEITVLEAHIADLQALLDRRMAAVVQFDAARTPDEIKAAKQAIADADAAIVLGLAQYGAVRVELDEFGVKATGAGDLVSDALAGGVNPMRVLSRGGVRVTGAGPQHRLFERFAVRGAQMSQTPKADEGRMTAADVGSFEIGPTRLDIAARREGDSIFIDVPEFSIASIVLDRFLFTSVAGADGVQMWSDGASGIENVAFSGSVRLDSKVKGSDDLADFRPARLHVDSARIGRIYGNGLGFALLPDKLQLAIKSGSIGGIHAEQFDVTWPADEKAAPRFSGKVGVDSIDKLVLGESFVGAWRVGSGRVDARALSAEFAEDGGVKAAIGSLSLSAFAVRGPDGWVRFSLADLGARVSYREGVLDVEDIHFGSLTVAAMRWKVGASGFVQADAPSTITDLRLKARVETAPAAAKAGADPSAKPGREIRRLRVERLHIGRIESEHLVYQDEDNRIELKPADPMMARHMTGFRPLYLQNLDVWGVEWTPKDGLAGGKAQLGGYEASVNYRGLKTAVSGGLALRGAGMSAEVVGPGEFKLDVGRIEKTGGELHTRALNAGFATGTIVGKVLMGPDYVEARDVEVGKAHVSNIRWFDLPRQLKLDAVNVDRIKLGRVRQNYTVSTDPATKGEKTPGKLEVHDLELFDVLARELDYRGESRSVGEDAAAKMHVSTQHIRGRSATISHMKVGLFERDAVTGTGKLSATVDTAPDAKPGTKPFRIQGLSAELIDTIGSERTKTELMADVQGGPLTASGIEFGTVVLGEARGPDGKMADVTRTWVQGSFELNELGFLNPDLTLTDAQGKTTQIGGLVDSSVTLSGIRPRFLSNGAIALPIDALIARNLRIKRDNMTVRLPLVEIKSIAVGLRGMGTAQGMEWLAAKLGEIRIEGASIEIVKESKPRLSDEEYAAAMEAFKKEQEEAKKNPPGAFIAEPLSGLEGKVTGEYSLNNWEDPDIHADIKGGKLDFADLTNYGTWLVTENVTRDGVTRPEDKIVLGAFEIDLVEFKRKMPGFHGGSWDSGESGHIDFREMVEGLVNEPGSPPAREFKPSEGLRDLIDFSGELSLGEGRIGRDTTGDAQLGEGDTWVALKRSRPGQNVVKLHARSIGHELDLNMPELHFSEAGFTVGQTQAGKQRIGKTGDITLEQLSIKVKGLASYTLTLTLELKKGVIQDVRIGDVMFTDAAELAKLAPPTLTDVNPKGVPKE